MRSKAIIKYCGNGMRPTLCCLALSFFLAGCMTVPSPAERLKRADQIAGKANFKRLWYRAEPFWLTVYEKISAPGQPLHVYIEGDGYAWVSRTRISQDPTPRNPVALELAAEDPAANVLYLGRPCQYTPMTMNEPCSDIYWAEKRFSEEIVNSLDETISWYKEKAGSPGVDLIGYSGGAAAAVLVAARRDDVTSLRTVAGNLDPEGLNAYYGVSPLDKESLDPMDAAEKISTIPQQHFIGNKDKVVPAFISEDFLKKSGNSRCVQIMKVDGADHAKGWTENWIPLLQQPLSCQEKGR